MLLLPTTTFPNDKPAGVADIPLMELDADPPEEELPVAADFTLAHPPSATDTTQDISRISATLFIRFSAAVPERGCIAAACKPL